MDEKGFFTLIGICFLLMAAILVKGVQESERNFSYVTTDFQAETELQNIADSELIKAANMIKNNEIELKKSEVIFFNRKVNQHQIIDKTVDGVNVQVFYEYGNHIDEGKEVGTVYSLKRTRQSGEKYYDTTIEPKNPKKGVILISVASRDSDILSKTIYRRSLGYFLTDEDEDGILYFMNN